MAKAASPLRLQSELMEAAKVSGLLHHRSAAEQIEYWASIGRSVSQILSPDVLLSIRTGMARLTVEPVTAKPVDPDAVFAGLERDRVSGRLRSSVTTSAVRYQASARGPGWLEQHQPDGRVVIGRFEDGVFLPDSGAHR